MIARAESGHARDNMAEFDAAEIARDVGELYEPLAEEKGLALTVEAPAAAPVRGNRELVARRWRTWSTTRSNMPGRAAAKLNGVPAEIVVQAGDDGERIVLRSPIAARALPRPIAAASWNASCGSSRAARSPARVSA